MIDLRTTSSTLARFVRDLDEQAPRALDGMCAELSGACRADVEAAHVGWASRIVDEHRSVIVFSELLALLAGAGAPYEALAAVQRLIGDELRHVKLCAEVASMFGPLDALEIDLEDLALPTYGARELPAARALAIVARELVIGEGESIAVLRAYRDASSDPCCRAALSLLLADEARHHATGKHLLERLIASLPIATIEPLLETLPRTMRADAIEIRAAHRRAAQDGPGRAFGVSIREDEAPPPLELDALASLDPMASDVRA